MGFLALFSFVVKRLKVRFIIVFPLDARKIALLALGFPSQLDF